MFEVLFVMPWCVWLLQEAVALVSGFGLAPDRGGNVSCDCMCATVPSLWHLMRSTFFCGIWHGIKDVIHHTDFPKNVYS